MLAGNIHMQYFLKKCDMKQLLILALLLVTTVAGAQEYLKLGDACFGKKDYPCAYDNYVKAYETNMKANRSALFYRMGYCLNDMRKFAEAKTWLYRALAEKEDAGTLWELGISHYNSKLYDSAAIYYNKAHDLSTDKEDKQDLLYFSAVAYYENKQYAPARQKIDACLTIDPIYARGQILSGMIASAQKNYPLAEKAYLAASQQTKDSLWLTEIFFNMADMNYKQQKYSAAIPYYHNALRYEPGATYLLAGLADSHTYSNHTDSAEYYLQLLVDKTIANTRPIDSAYIGRLTVIMINNRMKVKDTLRALQFIPVMVKYNPKHTSTKGYIDLLFQKKETKTLELLLPVYLSSVSTNRDIFTLRNESQYYDQLGNLYREQKQLPKAMGAYRTSMQANPANTVPLVSMLRMLMEEKKYKEASDSIASRLPKLAAVLRPDVQHLQAEIVYIQKDTAAAAAIYRDVLKNTPVYSTNYTANYYLGLMALQRKDSVQCLSYWEKIRGYANSQVNKKEMAVPLFRFMGMHYYQKAAAGGTRSLYTDAGTYLGLAIATDSTEPTIRLHAGMANALAGNMTAGQGHLLKCITPYLKKKDTLAMIYKALGYIQMKNGTQPQFTEAIDYYQKAIAATPQDSSLVNDLGTVYYEKKDYAKAVEVYEQCLKIVKSKNSKSVLYYSQALSYYMNKQPAESKEKVMKSLEMDPQSASAKQLKAELEKPAG